MNRRDRVAVIRAQFLEAERNGETVHDCPQCAEARAMLMLADTKDHLLTTLADHATGRRRSHQIKHVLAVVDEQMALLDIPCLSGSVH
jgi:hypothetical protein